MLRRFISKVLYVIKLARVKRTSCISVVTVKKRQKKRQDTQAPSNCYATNDVVTSDLWSNYQFRFKRDKSLDEIQHYRRRF